MIHFRSILSRIISLHILAVGAACVAMPLAVFWLIESTATDLHHSALRQHADTLAHYISVESNNVITFDVPSQLRELYSHIYGRYAYAIVDSDGRVLFSSSDDEALFPALLRGVTSYGEVKRGESVLYGASVPYVFSDKTYWIQVGEDITHRDVLIDDIQADFFLRVGWITIPILLFLLIIDIVIIRRALQPITEASRRAAKIGPARTDVRLPVAGVPDEIRPLIGAVNQALDRLEEGFRIQREFTADAAHELGTPLAILRMRIDLVMAGDLARAMRKDVDHMSRVIGQLLDVAELDNFVVEPSERADLRSIVMEVAEFVAPLAVAQDKSVAVNDDPGPTWVQGNRETLFRAVRNLTENALAYTPARSTVELSIRPNGSVTVSDHGPGIANSDMPHIFQRFWRKDRTKVGGAGLGLSIVAKIVEAHQGTVAVRNRPNGGAEFTITIPLVASADCETDDANYATIPNQARSVNRLTNDASGY